METEFFNEGYAPIDLEAEIETVAQNLEDAGEIERLEDFLRELNL